MSNDPITYTSDRIDIIDKKIAELPDIFLVDGETSTCLLYTSDAADDTP